MKFERTRVGLFVGIICALIASAIAGKGDGLYVPFSMPATTCVAQFIRSITIRTGAGTCATVSLTADVTDALPVANGGLAATSIPNFKVTLTGGNQTVTSGVITKVAFDTVVIDIGSYWSTSNKNYLPLVAGTYMFCTQVAGNATFTLGNDLAMFISKNGISGGAGIVQTNYQGLAPTLTAATQAMSDCTITAMNGSTDTIEVDVAINGTSPNVVSNSNPQTYFFGWRISP